MEIGKPTTVDVKESANEGQIGGNHYKKLQIQPWDYILANNIGYCEGSAIKYLSRWRDKGRHTRPLQSQAFYRQAHRA
jgi:hypothetical protein